MIRHKGLKDYRCASNRLEKKFADEWLSINDDKRGGAGVLAHILAENPNAPCNEVSERDAVVAATVIQWLGSPVGQCFLRGISEEE